MIWRRLTRFSEELSPTPPFPCVIRPSRFWSVLDAFSSCSLPLRHPARSVRLIPTRDERQRTPECSLLLLVPDSVPFYQTDDARNRCCAAIREEQSESSRWTNSLGLIAPCLDSPLEGLQNRSTRLLRFGSHEEETEPIEHGRSHPEGLPAPASSPRVGDEDALLQPTPTAQARRTSRLLRRWISISDPGVEDQTKDTLPASHPWKRAFGRPELAPLSKKFDFQGRKNIREWARFACPSRFASRP